MFEPRKTAQRERFAPWGAFTTGANPLHDLSQAVPSGPGKSRFIAPFWVVVSPYRSTEIVENRNQTGEDLLTRSRRPSGYSLNTTPSTVTAFGNLNRARVAATFFKLLLNRRLNAAEVVSSSSDFVILAYL